MRRSKVRFFKKRSKAGGGWRGEEEGGATFLVMVYHEGRERGLKNQAER
jgi:hypothetical protein